MTVLVSDGQAIVQLDVPVTDMTCDYCTAVALSPVSIFGEELIKGNSQMAEFVAAEHE